MSYSLLHLKVRSVDAQRYLHFIREPSYIETVKGVLTDDDERMLEQKLIENPDAGDLVRGTGGARKVRVGRSEAGRGTRGGARVIYYFRSRIGRVHLLVAYAKGDADDLSKAGKDLIKAYIAHIEAEEA